MDIGQLLHFQGILINMFYDFLCRRTGLDPRDKKMKADVKEIEQKIQSTSFLEFYGDFRFQEPYESRLLELLKHYYLQFQRKDTNIKPTQFYGPVILSEQQIQSSEFIIQEKVYVYQLTSSLDLNFKDIIKKYPDLEVEIFVLDPKANGFNLDKNKQIKKYPTKLCKYKKYQYHNPDQALSVYINNIQDINFKAQIPTQILNQDGLNFLTQKYPGINEPGVWFRMKDSWQKARQDRSNLGVLNWNHGPGTLIWYSIEFNSISQYKDPSLLQKDHIWFIKDANFFINQNLPFRVTYQRPNDLIILGAGNIFWNYAQEDLICSEWNYLSLNQFSLEVFIEKIDQNFEKKQKSKIPMVNLLIDINLHQKNESIEQFLKSAIQDEVKIVQKDDLALKYLKQYCDNRIIYCKKCKSEPIIFYQIIDDKTNYCVNCLDLSVTIIILGARYIINLNDSFHDPIVTSCNQKICRKTNLTSNFQSFSTKLTKLQNIVDDKQQNNNPICLINYEKLSYASKIRIDQMKQIFSEIQMEYYKKLNKKIEGTLDLIKQITLNIEGYRQMEFDLFNELDDLKQFEGQTKVADLIIPSINHEKYAYLLRNFSDHEAIFQFYKDSSSLNHFTKFLQEIQAPWWEIIQEQYEFENKWKKLTQGWLKRAIRWHDEIDYELQLVVDDTSDQQNSLQQQNSIQQNKQIYKEEISKQFDQQKDQLVNQDDQEHKQKIQLNHDIQQDIKPKRRQKQVKAEDKNKKKNYNKNSKNKKTSKLTIKTRRQKILDEMNYPTEHIEPKQKKQSKRIPEREYQKEKQKKVRLFF